MAGRWDLKKGLTLPISGMPRQAIEPTPLPKKIALIASDYPGMRPTMEVEEGESVEAGQALFSDKKTDGLLYTAPASGRVARILRGEKRSFLGVELEVEQRPGREFFRPSQGLEAAGPDDLRHLLVESGLWTSLRARPFGKVPSPKTDPKALFVNAMDTHPLSADPQVVIGEAKESFRLGLLVLARAISAPLHLCRAAGSNTIPGEGLPGVELHEFSGPHPAGLVGTHMHFISPASSTRVNWHLSYQDVIAIGRLWETGRVDASRIISVAGPACTNPRLVQTLLGAPVDSLIGSDSKDGVRVISGSPLGGRRIDPALPYLGRYHTQVTLLNEGTEREFLGWQMPGFNKFSATRAFASAWVGGNDLPLTTSTGGSERAMVPIGTYEKVMPLDLLPTLLLRSLITRDLERAVELGCLELDEEDLSLCTFVCPGKYDYGEILRDNLQRIEKEV
jgi:Na+-transporting NADH:ubiquinone oxidoreductase subunit A